MSEYCSWMATLLGPCFRSRKESRENGRKLQNEVHGLPPAAGLQRLKSNAEAADVLGTARTLHSRERPHHGAEGL